MRLSLPSSGRQTRKAAAKKLVLKTVFNSREQKRIVTRAAQESAADQRRLMTRYEETTKK